MLLSSVLSTASCDGVTPPRFIATNVENGAISTIPPVAVILVAAFSVRLSATIEIRPPAVRVARVPGVPSAMVLPTPAAWKNRLLAVKGPVSVSDGLSTRMRLPVPTWMPLLAPIWLLALVNDTSPAPVVAMLIELAMIEPAPVSATPPALVVIVTDPTFSTPPLPIVRLGTTNAPLVAVAVPPPTIPPIVGPVVSLKTSAPA